MKRFLRNISLVAAAAMLAGCLGAADAPAGGGDVMYGDGLIGRFIRDLTPVDFDLLMNSPDILTIDEMLYLVGKTSVGKMVRVIQDTGAETVLDMMRAVRQMCQNYEITESVTLDSLHHLDLMSDVMNEMDNVDLLISMMKKESIDSTIPADPDLDQRQYMEKLAYLIVYMNDTEKMMFFMNGIEDTRDMVYFIDQFDPGLELPVTADDISGGTKLSGLTYVLSIIKEISDGSKLFPLMNGTRLSGGDDASQMQYINEKLIPLTEQQGGSNSIELWTRKMVSMINNSSDMNQMTRLITAVDAADVPTMITLIGALADPGDAPFINNSIPTMSRTVSIVTEIDKMVELMRGIDPLKMADFINLVARSSVYDDSGAEDTRAAGQKMGAMLNRLDSDKVYRMRDLVNHVTEMSKITALVDFLSIANAFKAADFINDVSAGIWNPPGTPEWREDGDPLNDPPPVRLFNLLNAPGTDYPDTGTPGSIDTIGYTIDNVNDPAIMIFLTDNVAPDKMAGLVNEVDAGSFTDDSGNPDTLAAGKKLTAVINAIDDPEDMVFLMNSITDPLDMAGLMNRMKISGCVKTGEVMNGITGTNSWNPGDTGASRGMGKMVNMVERITSLDEVAVLIDSIDDSLKLVAFINLVADSDLQVELINLVNSDADAGANDMASMMNSLTVEDMPLIAAVVNNTADSDSGKTTRALTLMAQLLRPSTLPFSRKGLGYQHMADLVRLLQNEASAGEMGVLMKNLNSDIPYRTGPVPGNNIEAREAMVRLAGSAPGEGVAFYYGPASADVLFPGVGISFIAVMINGADEGKKIADLMNALPLDELVVQMGCGERLDAVDFNTPCSACGRGW